MHFIKLSPTQLVQFNNDLELVCTHTFTPQTSKMSGEVPATYKIEQNDDKNSDWQYTGEAALSLYEYFFNYQSEVRNVMSVEELRLDSKLTRKLEQQKRINDLNYDLAEHEILVTRSRMNAEREQILESQARSLYPGKKLVS
jgi:hypothetical protein